MKGFLAVIWLIKQVIKQLIKKLSNFAMFFNWFCYWNFSVHWVWDASDASDSSDVFGIKSLNPFPLEWCIAPFGCDVGEYLCYKAFGKHGMSFYDGVLVWDR